MLLCYFFYDAYKVVCWGYKKIYTKLWIAPFPPPLKCAFYDTLIKQKANFNGKKKKTLYIYTYINGYTYI